MAAASMSSSNDVLIKPCSSCGKPPGAKVQVSASLKIVWLLCETCGKRTSDDQTFEQARLEWNREVA